MVMGGQLEPRVGFRARVRKNFSSFIHSKAPKKGLEDSKLCVESINLSNDSSLSSITSEKPREFYHEDPDISPEKKQDYVGNRPESDGVDGKESLWPEEFLCPISRALMADPVIVESGVSYERQNVLAYLKMGYTTCFKTGDRLEHVGLTKNSALKKAIDNWCDSHQVPRPVAPDFQTAQWTVVQIYEPDSFETTASRSPTLSQPPVSSESSSSGKSSGGGSKSVEVKSLKVPLAVAPEMPAPLRSPDPSLSPEQIPETYLVDTSSSDLSHSAEGQWNGDGAYETHNQSLFPEAHSSHERTASAVVADRYWSSPLSPLYTHSSSVVHSATASSFGVGAHQQSDTGVPLRLTTTPSAFSEQKAGSEPLSSNADNANEPIVRDYIQKLQHRHPLEQEQAVIAIRRLTRVSAENRVTLCELELLEVLLPLAQSRYTNVQTNAVAAIMNMSLEKENKLKVARAGSIPCLVDVLKSGHFEAQEHAAGAIFSLALNDENKMAIGVLGAIPPLIHVLRSGKHGARRDAAMALYHLSLSQMNRNKLIKAGGVGILLGIAKDEESDVVSQALLILFNIAAMQEGRVALSELNAVQVMVGLLRGGDETRAANPTAQEGEEDVKVNRAEVREHAAATLLQLSHHNFRFKSQALQAGALDALQRLAMEGTPRAREKAAALLIVLRDAGNADNPMEGTSSMYQRSYVRNARGGVDDKAESAKF